jgi:predicted nucleic acid-binding protein
MALYDLADPDVLLPSQLVLDSSLLLALRPDDDNPHVAVAQAFVRRLRPRIAELELVVWLPLPVLQECYHIILTSSLRRVWQALDPVTRPANWLAAYKHDPTLLRFGLPELARFDTLLATIPLTLARPQDFGEPTATGRMAQHIRHFIADYWLLPQDALILAEADRLGVRAVATLDRDWRRVAEFDVYTPLLTSFH